MQHRKPTSLQEINRLRQRESFIGREEQINLFRGNLALPIEDERRRFIFAVSGQGGVGKSSLLRRFRQLAEAVGAATAMVDEDEHDVPTMLARLAEQFEAQGCELKSFSTRYRVFRQRRQELETDPDAPQGFSKMLGRTVAKGGLRLVKTAPGVGSLVDLLDEEAIASQAGDWASYVARKIGNKDEVRLVQQPLAELTPLWLADLAQLAEKRQVLICFDTFERTSDYLESWLLDLFDGRYGDVAPTICWVIAGRDSLDENRWSPYAGLISHFPLEPFSDEEARAYLERKGVTNAKVIEVILALSGKLPLLVAMLAAESPNDPAQVGDPTGTAVERFLKWVDDQQQRQIALDLALPRRFNRDVLAALVEADEPSRERLFTWLITMPFVREREDGWVYHDVVRSQMLRYQHRVSPQRYANLHSTLATWYEGRCSDLGLPTSQQWKDEQWRQHQYNTLYHRLCGHPQRELPWAISQSLVALHASLSYAVAWGETMQAAGRLCESATMLQWAADLSVTLKAYEEDDLIGATTGFTKLIQYPDLAPFAKAVAYDWRGHCLWRAKQYDKARSDLDQAVALAPEEPVFYVDRGLVHRDQQQYEAALVDQSRAITLDPTLARAFVERGATYRQMKRYEEALTDFTQAIALDANDAWVYAQRAQTYRKMGQYELALVDLTQAVKLDAKYIWAYAERGDIYRFIAQYELALEDFTQVIRLDANSAWAYARRGEIYRLMERYEAAKRDFTQAIALDSNDVWALGGRGQTYRQLKRYEEAEKDFTQAITLNFHYIWAYAQRGEIYQLVEQYDAALTDFSQAITLDPGEDWWYLLRSLNYQTQLQHELAKADLLTALEIVQKRYATAPEDHNNNANFVLYSWLAGETATAETLGAVVAQSVPLAALHKFLDNLNNLIAVFPGIAELLELKQRVDQIIEGRQS
ncbi:MAG: tetratricopeptide repeat protein [Chloroflexaceae bacterium]|jgi:tetratricopeptide (TPR) repeat protein|nr:tetratricopeptide repeat protein [Chloroflexaceae bacterium]